MANAQDATPTHQPYLGRQLKALRAGGNLSIADVAQATGLSSSFLSLVESGRSDISIGRVIKLANFFRVGFSDLLPDHSHSTPEVIRAGEHPELDVDDDQMTVRLLTQETHRTMQPVVVTFAPGGHTEDSLEHPAEVVLYVIDGELTLQIEGWDTAVLRAGDSVYLEAGTPRSYRNEGDGPVTYMGVVGSPQMPSHNRPNANSLVRSEPKPRGRTRRTKVSG